MSRKVCVIGAGLIGRNWAVLFARAGFQVVMFDISSQQLDQAKQDITEQKLPQMNKYGMLFGNTPEQVLSNVVEYTTDITKAITGSIWIQTGVPESLEMKQKVLVDLSNAVSIAMEQGKLMEHPIIASSTSTIQPSLLINPPSITDQFRHHFLVTHPVNPPMAIPAVEMVPSPDTNDSCMSKACEIMKEIGMKPIRMHRECAGFVVNRLQYALLNSAMQLYKEGVCSAEDIDKAVKHGLGLRWSFMGPFETIHLNAPKGVKDYCERYGKGSIEKVMNETDNLNQVEWDNETAHKIHSEMCQQSADVDSIPDKCRWRDERLMELARMKQSQELKDEVLQIEQSDLLKQTSKL